MASETQRFRELIEADEIVIQPGIYDGYSARLERRATATRKAAKYVAEAIG
jgi:2-methylisocitrate lyase-like PEP mutase family enzyme